MAQITMVWLYFCPINNRCKGWKVKRNCDDTGMVKREWKRIKAWTRREVFPWQRYPVGYRESPMDQLFNCKEISIEGEIRGERRENSLLRGSSTIIWTRINLKQREYCFVKREKYIFRIVEIFKSRPMRYWHEFTTIALIMRSIDSFPRNSIVVSSLVS